MPIENVRLINGSLFCGECDNVEGGTISGENVTEWIEIFTIERETFASVSVHDRTLRERVDKPARQLFPEEPDHPCNHRCKSHTLPTVHDGSVKFVLQPKRESTIFAVLSIEITPH